jgi:parallel beta-helix repeat protein
MLLTAPLLGFARNNETDSITLSFNEISSALALSYVDSPAISINSDSEFDADHGVSAGTGTELDPYIIDGLNISVETGNAIEIYDTTAYFIISNCKLRGGSEFSPNYYSAIALDVADGTAKIISNLCRYTYIGINVGESNNVLVINNSILYNPYMGIFCGDTSRSNDIHHNTFSGNGGGEYGGYQAYDSGVSNLWYEEETKEGNYWSDLGYNSGDAEAVDLYPLNALGERVYPPTEDDDAPAFNLFLASLSLIALALIVRKRR